MAALRIAAARREALARSAKRAEKLAPLRTPEEEAALAEARERRQAARQVEREELKQIAARRLKEEEARKAEEARAQAEAEAEREAELAPLREAQRKEREAKRAAAAAKAAEARAKAEAEAKEKARAEAEARAKAKAEEEARRREEAKRVAALQATVSLALEGAVECRAPPPGTKMGNMNTMTDEDLEEATDALVEVVATARSSGPAITAAGGAADPSPVSELFATAEDAALALPDICGRASAAAAESFMSAVRLQALMGTGGLAGSVGEVAAAHVARAAGAIAEAEGVAAAKDALAAFEESAVFGARQAALGGDGGEGANTVASFGWSTKAKDWRLDAEEDELDRQLKAPPAPASSSASAPAPLTALHLRAAVAHARQGNRAQATTQVERAIAAESAAVAKALPPMLRAAAGATASEAAMAAAGAGAAAANVGAALLLEGPVLVWARFADLCEAEGGDTAALGRSMATGAVDGLVGPVNQQTRYLRHARALAPCAARHLGADHPVAQKLTSLAEERAPPDALELRRREVAAAPSAPRREKSFEEQMAGWSKFKAAGKEAGPVAGVEVPGPELAWAKRNTAQQLAKTGQLAQASLLFEEAISVKAEHHRDERHPALLEDLLAMEAFYDAEGAALDGARERRLEASSRVVHCLEAVAQAADARPRGGVAAKVEAAVVRGAALLRYGAAMAESEELEDSLTVIVMGQDRAGALGAEADAEMSSRVAKGDVVQNLAAAFADEIESRRVI